MKRRIQLVGVVRNFVKLMSFLVLIIHFSLTFFYVMPTTPIKLKHYEFLNWAVGGIFPQNWSLFAPNPIARNDSLLVMCIPENIPVSNIHELPAEGWEDLTKPLWHALQRNRFTAYGRIERTQGNAIRQYNGLLSSLEVWRESCQKGSAESCKYYQEKFEDARERVKPKLLKIASSFCAETNSDNIGQVAIRLRYDSTLSWSKRYTGSRENTDSDVGVFPIDDQVILPGIYQAKRSL